MLATGQRVFGAARTALCLGLTLFILFSGAAVFLSSEPGARSWFSGILESVGLLDDESDAARDAAASSPSGTVAGSAGLHGAGESDLANGAAFDLSSEETTTSDRGVPSPGLVKALTGVPESGVGNRERVRAGTLYDLGTGATLTGARILATAYHGTNDPLNAGYPALFQEVVEVETGGSFHLPIFDPDDPRLLVHLQIDHPSYLPVTVVLERRDTVAAEWQQREIQLRRGLTSRVQITTADRRPLARVPVRVVPTHDGHALLERETVWVALRRSERLIARGEPSVRYTDDAGYLRLPYSEYNYVLEILHPL